MLNRRGGNWLGGQHLAIVRALAVKPNMLILDEPTERIQLSTIQNIIRVIRLLVDCSDRAILLPEQYYGLCQSAGRRLLGDRAQRIHCARLEQRHAGKSGTPDKDYLRTCWY